MQNSGPEVVLAGAGFSGKRHDGSRGVFLTEGSKGLLQFASREPIALGGNNDVIPLGGREEFQQLAVARLGRNVGIDEREAKGQTGSSAIASAPQPHAKAAPPAAIPDRATSASSTAGCGLQRAVFSRLPSARTCAERWPRPYPSAQTARCSQWWASPRAFPEARGAWRTTESHCCERATPRCGR